jgi:hypothetical protein
MTDRWGQSVSGVRERSGVWGLGVSGGEREGAYQFGVLGCWAGLVISSWADLVPGALFLFFIPFSISFSVFLIYFISFA